MADNEDSLNDETVHVSEEMMDTADNDSCDDSDGSESDEDGHESELKDKSDSIQQQVTDNPYMYDGHVELIKTLRELGDLDRLRAARQRMSELFPLSEELWLPWLQDEVGLVADDEGRKQVTQLFERAVKDYLSVPIWLEYGQFSIGGMGQNDGISRVRQTFDKALVAGGLHVSKGANLWEAYREFENAILTGLLPAPGNVPTKEQEDKFSEQHDRIQGLFKRQLTVPLMDMESTMEEYKDWLQDEPESYTKQVYNKALIKLEKIKPYEDKLLTADAPRLEEYKEYLSYEEANGDPARIQCLYERAVQENCLDSSMWLQYTKYLDMTLKVESVSVPVYERAVRNCPWCVQLWQNYLLLLERSSKPYEKVKEVFEAALLSGFSSGAEYLLLWTTFIDYLRRRIKWDAEHTEELQTFRLTIEKAIEQIDSYGVDGDTNCTLRQFWAAIEAKHCKNLEKGRSLWADTMVVGKANEASLWMEYYRFERLYGDNKHCRRVLQRALNSVTDWPESIIDAYVNFEREEGTLEQYEIALSRCAAQMARIKERREKEEAEESPGGHSKKKKFDKKPQKQNFDQRQPGGKHKQKQQPRKQQQRGESQSNTLPPDSDIKPYKRKHAEMESTENVFKVPTSISTKSTAPLQQDTLSSAPSGDAVEKSSPPGFKDGKSAPPPGFNGDKSIPPPGFKGGKSAPPPGFKGEKSAPPGFKVQEGGDSEAQSADIPDSEPPTKKQKIEGDSEMDDHSKDFRTVFVSNLSFNVDEKQLQAFFEKCGDVEEIRLIKNFKGKSKGYAYIQFKDQFAVVKALTYDRTNIDNRPMYVSKYEDRTNKPKAEFKYSTALEKSKLFIKNLPFTCTKEALQTLFEQHGELKDVRLVTYKSGQPKGLAFVEFVDEQCAAQAVIKTDGLMMGDHAISVAISNPPVRKAPVSQREETSFVPSLGGGKKETQSHGIARTQVVLMPRAVTKKPLAKSTPSAGSSGNASAAASSKDSDSDSKDSTKITGMSNSDFRKMLLKK